MTQAILVSEKDTVVVREQTLSHVVVAGRESGRIIVTGLMGPPGVSAISINDITNVDLSNLTNGSILVYDNTTSKWHATTLLNNQSIDSGQY